MKPMYFLSLLVVVLGMILAAPTLAQLAKPDTVPGEALTDEQMERFLLEAKVLERKQLSVGVTGTYRLNMTDGTSTRSAHLQVIDDSKPLFQGQTGTELNFRDCYKFNVAAYHLDRMINLNMVPVSVVRNVGGRTGAVTWWVEDVLMMERERHAKKIPAPNPEKWNHQMYQIRVFNELVYNVDANLTNLLITKDWNIVPVDFSRAFRRHTTLKSPANLTRVNPRIYEGLKNLDAAEVERKLKPYLMREEIRGLLARRDKIVQHFEKQIAAKGEAEVFILPPTE